MLTTPQIHADLVDKTQC